MLLRIFSPDWISPEERTLTSFHCPETTNSPRWMDNFLRLLHSGYLGCVKQTVLPSKNKWFLLTINSYDNHQPVIDPTVKEVASPYCCDQACAHDLDRSFPSWKERGCPLLSSSGKATLRDRKSWCLCRWRSKRCGHFQSSLVASVIKIPQTFFPSMQTSLTQFDLCFFCRSTYQIVKAQRHAWNNVCIEATAEGMASYFSNKLHIDSFFLWVKRKDDWPDHARLPCVSKNRAGVEKFR